MAAGAYRAIEAVLLLGEDVFLLVRTHPRLPQACKHGPLAFSVSGMAFVHRFNAACGGCSSWGRVRSKIND